MKNFSNFFQVFSFKCCLVIFFILTLNGCAWQMYKPGQDLKENYGVFFVTIDSDSDAVFYLLSEKYSELHGQPIVKVKSGSRPYFLSLPIGKYTAEKFIAMDKVSEKISREYFTIKNGRVTYIGHYKVSISKDRSYLKYAVRNDIEYSISLLSVSEIAELSKISMDSQVPNELL